MEEGVGSGGGRLDAAFQLAGCAVDHMLEELALAVEVLIEQRLRDSSGGRDVARGGGVVAMGAEDLLGSIQDGLAAGVGGEPALVSKHSLSKLAQGLGRGQGG